MRRGTRGFTLVELLIAIAILAIAVIGLLFTYVWMARMQAVNDETTRAMRAAEQAIEQIYGNTPFADIHRRYNTFVTDETLPPAYAYPYPVGPGGPCTFEVLSDGQIVFGPVGGGSTLMFAPPTGSPATTRVGRIQFPEGTIPGQLDETACAELGFTGNQADMNANGVSTDTGLTAYSILPVVVTLQFESIGGGTRTITYRKILIQR